MDEKEQARQELLARRAQFVALLDSYQPENIALCEALMRGDKDLKDTFKRIFHPLLGSLEPSLGGGLSLMYKIRRALDGETYFGGRNAVWDFLYRFYKYYVEQGRVEAVWPRIKAAIYPESFEKIDSGACLQDIFTRSELGRLKIKKIDLNSQPLNPEILPEPRHLQYVEELMITNSPDWVDYWPWAAMERLKKLRISSCGLVDLPAALAQLPKLEEIEVFDNQFDIFPAALAKCKNIKSISIQRNNIKQLPDWFFGLAKLWRLNISDNPLGQLDPRIWKMKSMEWLEVSNTGLRDLGKISSNPKLFWLTISGNALGHLPADLTRLPDLRILHAESCELAELPDFIGDFSKLESLYLSNNKFNTIPHTILKLKNLETFFVSGVRLESYPDMSKMSAYRISVSKELHSASEFAAIKKAFPKSYYF